MPAIAKVVLCKKCGAEVRSDWKFCPKCGDNLVCPRQGKDCAKK